MDPDLFLVIGLIVGVLTVPSLLSAFSESRTPRAGAVMVLIAGVLLVLAFQNKAGGYTVAEIPQIFSKVIGRYTP
jgi:uncharacterized membrane protein YjjP (DUF1212 family)